MHLVRSKLQLVTVLRDQTGNVYDDLSESQLRSELIATDVNDRMSKSAVYLVAHWDNRDQSALSASDESPEAWLRFFTHLFEHWNEVVLLSASR